MASFPVSEFPVSEFSMSEPSMATRNRFDLGQRVRYRVEQFIKGLRASLQTPDESLAETVLAPAQLALFRRMPLDARRHSLDVLRTLQRQGPTSRDLAVAALLHDVGKAAATEAGAYLGLWLRGPLVVLEAFAPGVLNRLAVPRPSPSIRYAVYVQLHHPAIGAAWAQEAGCSELTCWLIAHHQDASANGDPERMALLNRLQRADGEN